MKSQHKWKLVEGRRGKAEGEERQREREKTGEWYVGKMKIRCGRCC